MEEQINKTSREHDKHKKLIQNISNRQETRHPQNRNNHRKNPKKGNLTMFTVGSTID
jgi:hypothetical protein